MMGYYRCVQGHNTIVSYIILSTPHCMYVYSGASNDEVLVKELHVTDQHSHTAKIWKIYFTCLRVLVCYINLNISWMHEYGTYRSTSTICTPHFINVSCCLYCATMIPELQCLYGIGSLRTAAYHNLTRGRSNSTVITFSTNKEFISKRAFFSKWRPAGRRGYKKWKGFRKKIPLQYQYDNLNRPIITDLTFYIYFAKNHSFNYFWIVAKLEWTI
jgi:hypothetical protein